MRVLLVLDKFERENRYWRSEKIQSGSGHELEIIHLRSNSDSILKVEVNDNFIVLNNRVFKKPELLLVSHYKIFHSDDPYERVWIRDIEINGKSLTKEEKDMPSITIANTFDFTLKEYGVFIATIRADGISRLIDDFRDDGKGLQRLDDQLN